MLQIGTRGCWAVVVVAAVVTGCTEQAVEPSVETVASTDGALSSLTTSDAGCLEPWHVTIESPSWAAEVDNNGNGWVCFLDLGYPLDESALLFDDTFAPFESTEVTP